jgi:hypothetical protein
MVVGAVAALAVAAIAGTGAAGVQAAGAAQVTAYSLAERGAVDAVALRGAARVVLAKGLKGGDAGAAVPLPAGRVRLEIRQPGAGKARLLRSAMRLEAGRAYCLFLGGYHGALAVDVTPLMRADPTPGKVCRQVAEAGLD